MPVLASAVSALSTFYQDSLDPFDHDQVEISTVRLLAKLPTIAAYAYENLIGQPFLYPDNSLGSVHNFLRMTRIGRRQVYAGHTERQYTPITQR